MNGPQAEDIGRETKDEVLDEWSATRKLARKTGFEEITGHVLERDFWTVL